VNKKAFSLFELILVIILIGLIYSIVLDKISNKNSLHINKIENIKGILKAKTTEKISLIVFDKCKRVLINGKEKEFDSKIFQNIEVYRIKNETLEKVEFDPIFIKDKIYDVCFKFNIYKNGSSSSYIIKKENKFIILYPYFRDSKVVSDEDEAVKELTNQDLMDEDEE